MTTELGFLLDLLLNHKLPKPTKDAVAGRIREVETQLSVPSARFGPIPDRLPNVQSSTTVSLQAPSMQAIMARNPDLVQQSPTIGLTIREVEQPVAVVAQTQATAAAMASRQQAISESLAGKVDKTTGRPRKF